MVKPSVAVRGIVDSGWFLDNDPITGETSSVIQDYLKKGIRMWQANVNDECARHYPDDLWNCYIGYKAGPHIKCKLNSMKMHTKFQINLTINSKIFLQSPLQFNLNEIS